MSKTGVILSVICVVSSLNSLAQGYRKGPSFGIGAGMGISKHAGAYEAVDKLNIVKDYSGYRILVIDLKAGWYFNDRIGAHLNMNYSLPNSTISPYKSLFRGGLISYSPNSEPQIILSAGFGKYSAADDVERLGEGNLIDLAFGYEFSQNFVFQTNFIFGGMENIDRSDKFFSSSGEFFAQFTVNYLFYTRKTKSSN